MQQRPGEFIPDQLAPTRLKFLATLAIVQYRLSQKQDAESTVARLRDAMETADQTHRRELIEGLRQAEALIDRGDSVLPGKSDAEVVSEIGSRDESATFLIQRHRSDEPKR